MEIKFKITGGNGIFYGTFSKLEDAQEIAQEMADILQEDMFIEKIITEMVDCVIPN